MQRGGEAEEWSKEWGQLMVCLRCQVNGKPLEDSAAEWYKQNSALDGVTCV